jgi:hypothetical protein
VAINIAAQNDRLRDIFASFTRFNIRVLTISPSFQAGDPIDRSGARAR